MDGEGGGSRLVARAREATAPGSDGVLPAELRRRVVSRAFYDRDTETVARDLLGKVLLNFSPAAPRAGLVVEVEAYLGLEDPASHIGRGFTPRTQGIFGHPGKVYVYFIYGTHHCVNAVTLAREPYGAVLFRALEPLEQLPGHPGVRLGAPRSPTTGPGRLTRALGIDLSFNGGDITRGPLVVLDLGRKPPKIGRAPRVGITRAVDEPLRFYVEGNPHVSRPWPWE
jgi:DNA-3-methyladenine glycosylase